jgi:hypothetical protein
MGSRIESKHTSTFSLWSRVCDAGDRTTVQHLFHGVEKKVVKALAESEVEGSTVDRSMGHDGAR